MRASYTLMYNEGVRSKGVQKFNFLFTYYLVIQFWYSFQRLQYGRNKDYKIPFIYFLVSKISKCKSHQQIAKEFTACFEKGRKLETFSCQFSSLAFPIFLPFSE